MLQRAYNKYGKENIKFEILLYCNNNDLLFFEQRAIDSYNKKELYNICLNAGNTFGIKHSKKANKEKSIRQMGHVTSVITKEKIRKSLTGKKHTEERKRNISIAHKGKMTGFKHPRIKPIIQLKNNKKINFWISASDAFKELRIQRINIIKCCNKEYGRKSAGGYNWRFATDEEIKKFKEGKI
jgi:group I intron endonuclease